MKISIDQLRSNAPNRPLGYFEEVISLGRIDGGTLFLSHEDYQKLRRKYNTNPTPSKPEWPIWAKAFKWMAKPQDKGIGDVVARVIGDENSEAFKAWYKKTTGKDCGCKGRQIRWNKMYPLP